MTKNESIVVKHLREIGGEYDLNKKDLAEFNAQTARVFTLMNDGNWWSAAAIRRAAGGDYEASGGLRRMRTLRRVFLIEKKRIGPARSFSYRLVGLKPIEPQNNE